MSRFGVVSLLLVLCLDFGCSERFRRNRENDVDRVSRRTNLNNFLEYFAEHRLKSKQFRREKSRRSSKHFENHFDDPKLEGGDDPMQVLIIKSQGKNPPAYTTSHAPFPLSPNSVRMQLAHQNANRHFSHPTRKGFAPFHGHPLRDGFRPFFGDSSRYPCGPFSRHHFGPYLGPFGPCSKPPHVSPPKRPSSSQPHRTNVHPPSPPPSDFYFDPVKHPSELDLVPHQPPFFPPDMYHPEIHRPISYHPATHHSEPNFDPSYLYYDPPEPYYEPSYPHYDPLEPYYDYNDPHRPVMHPPETRPSDTYFHPPEPIFDPSEPDSDSFDIHSPGTLTPITHPSEPHFDSSDEPFVDPPDSIEEHDDDDDDAPDPIEDHDSTAELEAPFEGKMYDPDDPSSGFNPDLPQTKTIYSGKPQPPSTMPTTTSSSLFPMPDLYDISSIDLDTIPEKASASAGAKDGEDSEAQ